MSDILPCHACGQPGGEPHDEECPSAEHQAMLAGDPLAIAIHDPDECEECLLQQAVVECRRRCGNCCRAMIIEATELDARREPQIREKTEMLLDEPLFLLNSRSGPCVFLGEDAEGRATCLIYETRPLVCRLFLCEQSRSAPVPSNADAIGEISTSGPCPPDRSSG